MADAAHDLHPFFVQGGLLGVAAVHHRPVGAADERHFQNLRHFFHRFQRGGGAGAAGAGHHGRRLAAQHPAARAVGQPVQKAQHPGRRRRIVHRRAEHKAIGLLGQRQHIGRRAAEDAPPGLGAAAAAHAAAHRLGADVVDRRLDAVGIQRAGHLAQRRVGAAMRVRAAVNQQNVHNITSVCFCYIGITTRVMLAKSLVARQNLTERRTG